MVRGEAKVYAPRGKVLFVATVYAHLAAFHIPFMKLLREWGYEVHAAASPVHGRKVDVEAAGVICHDIPFVRSPIRPQNVVAYRKLRQLLGQQRFDLIHVHTPIAAWLGRLAAKKNHQGVVLYTAHGFHFYKGAPLFYWLFYYPAERLAARWTDGLIVVNSEDFDRAKRLGFKEGEDLFFVHGVGVDLTKFAKPLAKGDWVRKQLGLDEKDVVVTCIAEFTRTKNHAFLLTAWQEVVKQAPHAHLLLVGEGRLRGSVERKIATGGIPNVRLLGFRNDIPQLLHATDIFVLPSKREGLPRSVMEAMAAGKPVVATDVRGNRDLVEHGVTGFLVKLGDVDGFIWAILRLIRDPDLREQMGQAGIERIKAYSLDRVIQEMSEIYARYLIKSGPGQH